MKKHFTFLALSVLFTVGKSLAQVYTPIATTGYSLDAVAENTTAAATTFTAVDGNDDVLYSAAYGALYSSSQGLPNSGIITATNRTYQLQNYTGPNVLYIQYQEKDSLTFTTPAPYPAISLLGFSTEGSSSMSITVRFTDNSTQNFTGLTLADWYTGTAIYSGFDRCARSSGAPNFASGNPKMFGIDLAIACANQNKSIKRIIIRNNTATNARICIMAASGNVPVYAVSASTLAICNGSNVTLTASGMSSYTWAPVGSFAGSNSATINVSPTANTSYTLDGLSTNGCPGNTVVTINVGTGTPTLSFSGSTSTVCLGAAATITTSGAYTYVLSNGAANGGTFVPSATATYTINGTNACGTASAMTSITVTPLPLTISATSTLVCSGSPSTLTAGGANTYTWAPGVSTTSNYIVAPAANTVYTVTGFTTGNCHGSTVIAVNTQPNPTLSIVGSSAVCSGTASNLSVNGNAVSYTWTPGGSNALSIVINPTSNTLYSVTGKNATNCTASVSKLITVVQNPVVNVSVSNPTICVGGSSTLTASGASNYVWSQGSTNSVTTAANVVSPVLSDVFTVAGTSTAGCVTYTTASVEVFIPSIAVTPDQAICVGTNLTIGASGANSYTWLNDNSTNPNLAINPATSTAYTVVGVVDNLAGVSCNATSVIQITVNANPTITAVSSPTAICLGKTATLTADGAGAAGTYTWTGGAGSLTTAVVSVSPISTIAYTVNSKDANGCKGKAVIILAVTPCTGIAENFANTIDLSVYPNPNNGEFTIKSDETITLQIINELGQLVKTISLQSGSADVKVSNLKSGVYFIMGKNENGSVKEKLIITQ